MIDTHVGSGHAADYGFPIRRRTSCERPLVNHCQDMTRSDSHGGMPFKCPSKWAENLFSRAVIILMSIFQRGHSLFDTTEQEHEEAALNENNASALQGYVCDFGTTPDPSIEAPEVSKAKESE